MNQAAAARPMLPGARLGPPSPPARSRAAQTSVYAGIPARADDLVDQLSTSSLAVALDQAFGSRTAHKARITRDKSTILVEFEESDYSISVKRDMSQDSFRSSLTAIVRAPAPDLSTWWAEWSLTGDAGTLFDQHVESIRTHRSRFIEMVDRYVNGRCAGWSLGGQA